MSTCLIYLNDDIGLVESGCTIVCVLAPEEYSSFDDGKTMAFIIIISRIFTWFHHWNQMNFINHLKLLLASNIQTDIVRRVSFRIWRGSTSVDHQKCCHSHCFKIHSPKGRQVSQQRKSIAHKNLIHSIYHKQTKYNTWNCNGQSSVMDILSVKRTTSISQPHWKYV